MTTRTWVLVLAVVGILLAWPREIRDLPIDVASLNLACRPVSQGAECRLLALFRDGTRPPRDVTTWAAWFMAGTAELHASPRGAIQASGTGDVVVATRYQSHTARAVIRLAPDRPAQLLAMVHGTVYVFERGTLTPVAQARVEVVDGPSLGLHSTTRVEGTYALTPLMPGHLVIRVSKGGFTGTDLPVDVQPGDNTVSAVLFAEPWNGGRAL